VAPDNDKIEERVHLIFQMKRNPRDLVIKVIIVPHLPPRSEERGDAMLSSKQFFANAEDISKYS